MERSGWREKGNWYNCVNKSIIELTVVLLRTVEVLQLLELPFLSPVPFRPHVVTLVV